MKWKYVESREWVQKKREEIWYMQPFLFFSLLFFFVVVIVVVVLPFLFHCQFNPQIPTSILLLILFSFIALSTHSHLHHLYFFSPFYIIYFSILTFNIPFLSLKLHQIKLFSLYILQFILSLLKKRFRERKVLDIYVNLAYSNKLPLYFINFHLFYIN